MALSNGAMIVAANALRAGITHLHLHTGDPGAGGTANQSSAAIEAVTWAAATANGDFNISATINFTGGAASGVCTYVTGWSAVGGPGTANHMGTWALTGDQTFNAAGEYSLTSLAQDGAST